MLAEPLGILLYLGNNIVAAQFGGAADMELFAVLKSDIYRRRILGKVGRYYIDLARGVGGAVFL